MLKTLNKTSFQLSQNLSHNPRNYRKPIDIEKLLWWVYQQQYAHTVTVDDDMRISQGLGYGSGAGRFEELAMLGTLVQRSGGGSIDVHPDAEAVHSAVLTLPELACGLVIMHGVAGTRPDWMPGAVPKPEAIRRKNGKPKLVYFDAMKRKPSYCPIRYVPEPGRLTMSRSMYEAWWEALGGLAEVLTGLRDYEVHPVTAVQAPWLC